MKKNYFNLFVVTLALVMNASSVFAQDKIVLLGDGASIGDLDEDAQTAYTWAQEEYSGAVYVDFSALTANDLSGAKVVWWHWDGPAGEAVAGYDAMATKELTLPDAAEEQSVIDILTAYREAGGSFLFGVFAAQYANVIGATKILPNIVGRAEEGSLNPDNWGFGVNADQRYHPLFDGMPDDEYENFYGYGFGTLMSETGLREDAANWFNLDPEGSLANAIQDPDSLNGTILAGTEWSIQEATDETSFASIIEFNGSDAGGKTIVISAGCNDWFLYDEVGAEAPNTSIENLKLLHENTFSYLIDESGITETAIENIYNDNVNLNVYPNPAENIVNFSFTLAEGTDVQISIYNITGQLITETSHSVLTSGSQSISMDLSTLGKGVYMYKINFDTNQVAGRLTKK